MEFERRTIRADDGAELAVWVSRQGTTPVVMVHGFPETHVCWQPVLAAFAMDDLRPYKVIVYDLRGFGQSAKTGEASLNRFYYDHETVIAKLGLERYHLVGHDWGGAIGLHVARFRPETLISLAVMNTNYWKTDVFGMWHMLFFNLPFVPPICFKALPDRMFNFGVLGAFTNPDRLKRPSRDTYRNMFRDRATSRYWIRLYRKMGRSLISRRLRVLRRLALFREAAQPARSSSAYHTRIRLIWGMQDRFNPPWVGRDLKHQLDKRGAKVGIDFIDDAGHFVPEEQPEAVAACLRHHWRHHVPKAEKATQ